MKATIIPRIRATHAAPMRDDVLTWRERIAELKRIYVQPRSQVEVRMTRIGYEADPTTASGRRETYTIIRYAKQGPQR